MNKQVPYRAQRPAEGAEPVARHGTAAREVAEAVRFLLSGRASYITGQSLMVDGGLSTV